MDKQSLRFGNWVQNAHGRELQVTNMDSTSKLSPIPLTEEWLKKFCFLYDGGHALFHKGGYGWSFVEMGVGMHCLVSKGGGAINLTIKYIHQLQNLYYCLTEEELTIK